MLTDGRGGGDGPEIWRGVARQQRRSHFSFFTHTVQYYLFFLQIIIKHFTPAESLCSKNTGHASAEELLVLYPKLTVLWFCFYTIFDIKTFYQNHSNILL